MTDQIIMRTTARQPDHDSTEAPRPGWWPINAWKVRDVRFTWQGLIGQRFCDCPARGITPVIEGARGHDGWQADNNARQPDFMKARDFSVIRSWYHDMMQRIEGLMTKTERLIPARPAPNISPEREGMF